MPRIDYKDIINELMELCRELCSDIKLQLNYYRASVYKHEMANTIDLKIEKLELIVKLMGNEMLLEPFKDYEATIRNGNIIPIPGECSLSSRVTRLISNLENHMQTLESSLVDSKPTHTYQSYQGLTVNIQKHKQKILSLCKQGSRQWDFFHTL